MIQNFPAELEGASYWAYMAIAVATKLDRIVKSSSGGPRAIPEGVRRDALRFLVLALERKNRPADWAASHSAFLVAHVALQGAERATAAADDETTIRAYEQFLRKLPETPTLDSGQVRLADELRAFMLRIHQRGSSEEYARRMDEEFGETVPVIS